MTQDRAFERIGIDTGGTFTDAVAIRGGVAQVLKLPSTPDDPGRAALEAARAFGLDATTTGSVVHGTTVGLNALLQRRHARTAFVTNEGFRHFVEIGRQDRPSLYELEPQRVPFPVPRERRHTLRVRRSASGDVLDALDEAELERLIETLRADGIETVAVCLLHAPDHRADEIRIAAALRQAGFDVSCSHEVLPRIGEFERAAATTFNAAIRPIVGRYVERLTRELAPNELRIGRNTGGVLDPIEAVDHPVRSVLSGPAGGVQAAARLGEALGITTLATLDMGGTSTDVALVRDGRPERTERPTDLAGAPFAVPTFDIHTIGCGGGSIARVDGGGALRVGPESAGADPGPACYGKGEEATVTDAHVVLGHIGAESLLGGRMKIDPDRSVHVVGALAGSLGLSLRACAEGILDVADVAMARALSVITSARAVDPASATLLAFGGAGPLHAARLAERCGMDRAIVPQAPGAFSALGLALGEPSFERHVTLGGPWDGAEQLDRLSRLSTAAFEEAERDRPGSVPRHSRSVSVALRYLGQGASLEVPLTADAIEVFHGLHERRCGFRSTRTVEMVELICRADDAPRPWPERLEPHSDQGEEGPGSPPDRRTSTAPADGLELPVRSRASIEGRLEGPVLIAEETTVTWVPAEWSVHIHAGHLHLDRNTEKSGV